MYLEMLRSPSQTEFAHQDCSTLLDNSVLGSKMLNNNWKKLYIQITDKIKSHLQSKDQAPGKVWAKGSGMSTHLLQITYIKADIQPSTLQYLIPHIGIKKISQF